MFAISHAGWPGGSKRMPPREEGSTSRGGLQENTSALFRNNWQKALNGYCDLLCRKEQQYWNGRICDAAAAHNPRSLWNSLNHLLHPAKVELHTLPTY